MKCFPDAAAVFCATIRTLYHRLALMKVSVIFSTYNSPEWLQKVLWGYQQQTHRDFEIIVADDGSKDDTKALIEKAREETGLTIEHVWQADDGFQKCRILNKAILHAKQDYVIFSDGDCIPREDFVEEHIKNAESNTYLSGSYYKLPMSTSKTISYEDIVEQRCFDVSWLRRNGLPRMRKTLKISASKRVAPWLNRFTTTKCNLKGSNASCWLKDIVAINGFDERMQWGGLDREFGVRLINHGIKPKHVRYNAICVHLDHSRGYKDPKMVAANKKLRVDNARDGITWTDYGMSQLLDAGYSPAHDYVSQQVRKCIKND